MAIVVWTPDNLDRALDALERLPHLAGPQGSLRCRENDMSARRRKTSPGRGTGQKPACPCEKLRFLTKHIMGGDLKAPTWLPPAMSVQVGS
jgi:hypothetical protein